MKTLKYSIGTRVTVRCGARAAFNGTIVSINLMPQGLADYLVENDQDQNDYFCFEQEVKIRYDNPKPFTLWCNVAQPMTTNV